MAKHKRNHNKVSRNSAVNMPATNRNYKDTVFRMLFSDRKNLLSLYNAVNQSNYNNPGDLEIVTLENAIYTQKKQRKYKKYERKYESQHYRHHAHRRFADHHHLLSHLIGRSCGIYDIYDFVLTIRRGTMPLCATCRTSRCLDNPHRQMRTLYVFHNT